jgi:hypothetical protein
MKFPLAGVSLIEAALFGAAAGPGELLVAMNVECALYLNSTSRVQVPQEKPKIYNR